MNNDKHHPDDEGQGTSGEEGQGTSGEEGQGGKSGQIEFKDFLAAGDPKRDDLLSSDERKRLLIIHKESHEYRVKKQKSLREERAALKEGKIALANYRQQMSGMGTPYKVNPILANKAQFSGIDRQVQLLPNEHVADTNPGQREELEYRYRLTNQPSYMPHFNPKPQYR